jgi:hypothetical protein
MTRFLSYFGISAKLGACAFCMRMAFVSATVAWLVAFGVQLVLHQQAVALVVAAIALALSFLWIAHLTAYSARRARCTVRTATMDTAGNVTRHSRRDLFPLFAKTFALAALATALPAIYSAARADDDGGCPAATPVPCGTQYCCAGQAVWFCQGYTGNFEQWKQMGSFCTNANTDEAVADLRANCAVLTAC